MDGTTSRWRDSLPWAVCIGFWAILSVILTSLAIILSTPVLGGLRAFHRCTGLWVRQLFALGGITLDVEGWESLPEDIRTGRQPAIFMANHESNLDPPVLNAVIPIPAVYLSKKELLWVPLVGWASWLAGVIFIDRSNRERAGRSLHRAIGEIRQGKRVVMFPEGTRTRNGELAAFKKGGFTLAMDAGVPIVPMGTRGGFHLLPSGGWRIRPGAYVVRFGAPVLPADHPTRESLMAAVQAQIADLRRPR